MNIVTSLKTNSYRSAVVFLAIILISVTGAGWADTLQEINIGVLALRGEAKTMKMWSPTAEYLTDSIPGYIFNIVPLDNDNMAEAVASKTVNFVLSSPASYASLEATHGVSRIVTLRNRRINGVFTKLWL